LLGLSLFVTAGPAAAKKVEVDFWEVACLLDPGIDWLDDGILHGRGRTTYAVFYAWDPVAEEAVVVGSGTVVSNADLTFPEGTGGLFGVHSTLYPSVSELGTFQGTWSGHLKEWVEFSGSGVGRGTGPLEGAKMLLTIASDPIPEWLLEELTTNPPECEVVSIAHDTGFIIGLRNN
jgi:hypothetical protein